MSTDNDATMLRLIGNTITDLQIQYRAASLEDQSMLAGPLNQMLQDYGVYQARRLKSGTITNDSELSEMRSIQDAISDNATRQQLLLAIAKIVALIAST